MNVQHWLAGDVPDDAKGRYAPVVCPACTKMHFIHNSTGKLLCEKQILKRSGTAKGRSLPA
jgi:hypothetical protein